MQLYKNDIEREKNPIQNVGEINKQENKVLKTKKKKEA
jgi:hypothetical protein